MCVYIYNNEMYEEYRWPQLQGEGTPHVRRALTLRPSRKGQEGTAGGRGEEEEEGGKGRSLSAFLLSRTPNLL